jgi:hypothetical protein
MLTATQHRNTERCHSNLCKNTLIKPEDFKQSSREAEARIKTTIATISVLYAKQKVTK